MPKLLHPLLAGNKTVAEIITIGDQVSVHSSSGGITNAPWTKEVTGIIGNAVYFDNESEGYELKAEHLLGILKPRKMIDGQRVVIKHFTMAK